MTFYLTGAIPDEVIERLEFLGRVKSDAQWEIGRLTVTILEMIEKHDRETGYMDVYRYVGDLTGLRDRSVRRYVAVCQFYSPQTASEFDVLPFEYFAEAMQFPHRWRAMLEAAVAGIDSHGRPPGVGWMTYQFQRQIYDDQERAVSAAPHDAHADMIAYNAVADVLVDRLETARDQAEYSHSEGAFLIKSILRVIELMKSNIAKLPVSSERKGAILVSVQNLIDNIKEVELGKEVIDTAPRM